MPFLLSSHPGHVLTVTKQALQTSGPTDQKIKTPVDQAEGDGVKGKPYKIQKGIFTGSLIPFVF